ncbi:class I SAM-dependent methyltransferase [Iodidimonas sp. SYSU 1G8]|uniref:class I SAM-dependent methyltransferase n=1 Tax=Iodidimonas sp. SYSU 1G8 TaxID=3133967 RepID=UPI0031FF0EA3
MSLDITELQAFYASPLGRLAQMLLRARMVETWPDMHGQVVGFGYAGPLLRGLDHVRPPVLLMPAQQGVAHWPRGLPNRAALVEDEHLPLADASVDHLVVVHGLEHTENTRKLLREFWRILAPEGRILVILPHRGSPWSFMERTPFGHGRPYSVGQARRLLAGAMLEPLSWGGALFSLPAQNRAAISLVRWMERPGARLWPRLAGVLLVEARKSVTARIDGGQKRTALAYARA